MSSQSILIEKQEAVLTITLNRPEVLNSINCEMAKALQDALRIAKENSVRSVLLTGAGRAFCAGQDLAEVAPSEKGEVGDLGKIVKENYNPIILAIRELEKPVVCAVNGIAAGAGANLAFSCDIVLAADSASFIQSFSKVGLIPDSGGTFLLPRIVGLGRAAALTMLGEKLSASEACNIGLVYKVFPAEKLVDEANSLTRNLSLQPTRGFALTKRAFNLSFDNSLREQLNLEEQLQREAGKSHDYVEGVKAFLGKRKPEFTGQ